MSAKPTTTESPDAGRGNILAELRSSGEAAAANGPDLSSLQSRTTRRVSTQTLVMALVLSTSAASLYLMRMQGIKSGFKLKLTDLKVDEGLERLAAPASPQQRQIMADIENSALPFQAPVEKLQKNPFLLEGNETVEAPLDIKLPNQAELDRQKRLADIKSRLGTLQLNGVLQGTVPVARINGKMVKVGDMIEEFFLVAQIHDRCVDLIADGQNFTLNMADGALGGTPARKPGTPVPPTRPR